MESKSSYYRTVVEQWWRGSVVSPVSGEQIVAYGETVEEARRAVDLEIVKEAHARGLTVERIPGQPTLVNNPESGR